MTGAHKLVLHTSIVCVHLEIPLPQFRRHGFHLLQVTLADQSLVRNRQRLVKLGRFLTHQAALQSALEVANPQLRPAHAAQKYFHVPCVEGRVDARMDLGVSLLILHGDRCLLKLHFLPRTTAFSSILLASATSADSAAAQAETSELKADSCTPGAGDGTRTRDQQLGRL